MSGRRSVRGGVIRISSQPCDPPWFCRPATRLWLMRGIGDASFARDGRKRVAGSLYPRVNPSDFAAGIRVSCPRSLGGYWLYLAGHVRPSSPVAGGGVDVISVLWSRRVVRGYAPRTVAWSWLVQ